MNFLSATDKILLTLATVILFIFSYFMYDDSLLFPKDQSGNLEKIGQVYHLQKDVRLKNASQFSWLPANQSSEVYQKDSVFTGSESEASIQLNDGSIINLKENSLVTLNIKEGQMTLDLKYGNFIGQINQNSAIKVKSGKETFELKGENTGTSEKPVIQINKSRTGNIDFKLTKGSAKIQSKKTHQVLVVNQPVQVNKKGNIQEYKEPAAVVVTTPEPTPAQTNPDQRTMETKTAEASKITLQTLDKTQFTKFTEAEKVMIRWQANSPPGSQYQVQVSKDPNFTQVLFTKTTTQMEQVIDVPLGSGTYFWRVQTPGVNGAAPVVSNVNSFVVNIAGVPQWIHPQLQSKLNFEMPLDTKPENLKMEVKLLWKAEPKLNKFHWQISSDVDFKQILKESEVTTRETVTPKLASGNYFARVRAFDATNKPGNWSTVNNFELKITLKKNNRPSAPKLVKTNIKYNPSELLKRNPSSVPAPEISWIKVPEAISYKVQISTNKDFSEASTKTLNGNSLKVTDAKPGVQYFRVFAASKEGESPPSEVGMLTVILSDPVLSSIKPFLVVGNKPDQPPPVHEVTIQWSEIPFAKKYLVQLDENKDFSKAKQYEVTSSKFPLPFPQPGTFYVRVKALGENNVELGSFSNIESTIYTYKAPLGTPKIKEPMPNVTIFLQKDMAPYIWLEWGKVSSSIGYIVEVSTSEDFKNIVVSQQLKENRFLIKQKLPYGKIFWRIRALATDPDMNSPWVNNQFSLLHNKNEAVQ